MINITGCTEIIELDLETENERLVVDAVLSNQDKSFIVKLSRSVPYFSTEPAPPVNHAQIEIINENTKHRIELTEDTLLSGIYHSKAIPGLLVPGDTLKLLINNVDLKGNGEVENYWATAEMPEAVKLDSAEIVYNSDRIIWQILANFQDPKDINNFYQFKVVQNDNVLTRRPDDIRIYSDELIDGNYVNGGWMHTIDAGSEKPQFVDGDKIALQLISISETYFNFITAIHLETNTSVPLFDGPAANAQGNISGNALGIFTLTAVSEFIVIFNSEIHNQ